MKIRLEREKDGVVFYGTADRRGAFRSGYTFVEMWAVYCEDIGAHMENHSGRRGYEIQCWADRRYQWTAKGSPFGSITVDGQEFYVYDHDGVKRAAKQRRDEI